MKIWFYQTSWYRSNQYHRERFWNLCRGPVHTYPEIFVSANFFMRIHLASTRVRRIRSVYPEISVYARSPEWKFPYMLCIRIRVDARSRIFLYTLTSQYQNQSLFKLTHVEASSKQTRKPRIWRQNYRRLSFLCNAQALLTNPLRSPDTNRIRVDSRIRFVYATCGRRYFCIRIKIFADAKQLSKPFTVVINLFDKTKSSYLRYHPTYSQITTNHKVWSL